MFANSILDVALGLVFLYTLLSLVTTSVTEGFANLLSARSRALERWLAHMLDDSCDGGGRRGREVVDQMLAHPLIRGLRPRGLRARQAHSPDYIPPQTFTAVLLETLGPPTRPGSEVSRRPRDLAELEASIAAIDEGSPLRKLLLNLITPARDLREAEQIISAWFEAAMDRLRGWYARRSQLAAFGFAALLTWMLNADSLMLANALWHDAELRAAVVARAEVIADGDAGAPPSTAEFADELAQLRTISGFPLGWVEAGKPDLRAVPTTTVGWAEKLLGFALTVLATTLGAPFWFGLLSRVVEIRRATRDPSRDELRDASGPQRSRITTMVATRDGLAATDIDGIRRDPADP